MHAKKASDMSFAARASIIIINTEEDNVNPVPVVFSILFEARRGGCLSFFTDFALSCNACRYIIHKELTSAGEKKSHYPPKGPAGLFRQNIR